MGRHLIESVWTHTGSRYASVLHNLGSCRALPCQRNPAGSTVGASLAANDPACVESIPGLLRLSDFANVSRFMAEDQIN